MAPQQLSASSNQPNKPSGKRVQFSTLIAKSQDFTSLARLRHMSIPEAIAEAKGWNVLIGRAGSPTLPWASHRGHLARTLPLKGVGLHLPPGALTW